MESTKCRFSDCLWAGQICDLVKHCEANHRRFVKSINQNKGFTFDFSDILEDAFLLRGQDLGIFWFLLDRKESSTHVRGGIFAVSGADAVDYTARIGRMGDEIVTYLGPYTTAPVASDRFDLEWEVSSLAAMQREVPSKVIEVCFGEFNDCSDSSDISETPVWTEDDSEITDSGEEFQAEGEFYMLDEMYSTDYYSGCIACLGEQFNGDGCAVCTADLPTNFDLDGVKTDEDGPTFEDYVHWRFDQTVCENSNPSQKLWIPDEREDWGSVEETDVEECYRHLEMSEKIFAVGEDFYYVGDDESMVGSTSDSEKVEDYSGAYESDSMPTGLRGFADLSILGNSGGSSSSSSPGSSPGSSAASSDLEELSNGSPLAMSAKDKNQSTEEPTLTDDSEELGQGQGVVVKTPSVEEIYRSDDENEKMQNLNCETTVIEADFIIFCELDIEDISLIEGFQAEILLEQDGITNFLETLVMDDGSFSCVYTETALNAEELTEEDCENKPVI